MTVHVESPTEHDEPEYLTMPDDSAATSAFTPSLPTLVNRPPDTDAQSVSDVESISNGETVSDAADDFEEISYSEIPALAHTNKSHMQDDDLSDQDLECVTMSDTTIMPDTPTPAHPMPRTSSNPNNMADHARFNGLYLAAEPYPEPSKPLRLLFVGDGETPDATIARILCKVIASITGQVADKKAILDTAPQTEATAITSTKLNQFSIPVELVHVVDYRLIGEKMTVLLKGSETSSIHALTPDLAILFHMGDKDLPLLPAMAESLAHHKIPMLEIADTILTHSSEEGAQSCLITQTDQGDHFLRLSLILDDPNNEYASKTDVPMTVNAFVYALDDGHLSRHLSYIADHAASGFVGPTDGTPAQEKRRSLSAWSWPRHELARCIVTNMLGLLIALLAVQVLKYHFPQQLDPVSDLAIRIPKLQTALNSSGLATVNASDVLDYPTTTKIVSGTSKTTGIAFPTAATVHVAKPDHLLVSLPKPYWKSFQIAVFKNGKALSNVNNTRVIPGVIVVSLPQSDAHGQVHISILCDMVLRHNETIKVDLGNRLLQRVTYEKAAKGIQQDVSDVQNAAKFVKTKVASDVQSALNQSVCGIKYFGSNILDGFRSAGNVVGVASNHTASGLTYVAGMTYNTTSSIGWLIKNAIPQQRRLARAKTNALKIRTKLFGRSSVVKQEATMAKPGTASQAFLSLKSSAEKVQDFFHSRVYAMKRVVSRDSATDKLIKKPKVSSVVRVNVKWDTVTRSSGHGVSTKRDNRKGV